MAALVDDVARVLTAMLTHPTDRPPPYLLEQRMCGTLLLTVDLHNGLAASGARLTAQAERFSYLRGFQPTMSSAQARAAAVTADRAAYDAAAALTAELSGEGLRSAALAALEGRAPLSAEPIGRKRTLFN